MLNLSISFLFLNTVNCLAEAPKDLDEDQEIKKVQQQTVKMTCIAGQYWGNVLERIMEEKILYHRNGINKTLEVLCVDCLIECSVSSIIAQETRIGISCNTKETG